MTETPADTIRRAVGEFAKLKLSLTIAAVTDGHEGDPFVLVLDKITEWLTWSAEHAYGGNLRHALAVSRTYLGED